MPGSSLGSVFEMNSSRNRGRRRVEEENEEKDEKKYPPFYPALVLGCLLLVLALAGCSGPGKELAVEDKAEARKLYVAKCAKCHKFYDPAKYSDAEWRTWMEKMSKKAKLKPEQAEKLSQYIEDTYRAGRT